MIILQVAGLIVAVALLLIPIGWMVGMVLDYRKPIHGASKDGIKYERTPIIKRKAKK